MDIALNTGEGLPLPLISTDYLNEYARSVLLLLRERGIITQQQYEDCVAMLRKEAW